MAREPGDYALLVGIEDYPRYRGLAGPRADVAAVQEWLLDDAYGGGLDAAHLQTVLSSATPPEPVQQRIDDALDQVFRDAEAAGDGRRLYVYFSGHGIGSRQDEVNLCLAGWSLRYRNAALRSSEYRDLIRDGGLFPEVVFLLDCCRVRKVGAPGVGPLLGFAQPAGRPSRTFVGFATEYQNAAYEAESGDDDPNGVAPRGYFTAAFLEAVWGAAARDAGGVTATRLKEYLEVQTPRLAEAGGHAQTPEVQNGFPGGAMEPVFGRSRPVIPIEIRFAAARTGVVTLLGPDADVVRADDVSTGPWKLELEPGLYALKDANGDEQHVRLHRPREANVVEF